MLYKKGDKGRHVKEIQQMLDFHGFWTYKKITDNFGPVTEKAVKAFQKDRGLKPDGVVGPTTLNELLERVDADLYTIDDKPVIDTDGKLDIKGTILTATGAPIHHMHLDTDEYIRDYGLRMFRYFFIHHTAGGHDPVRTAKNWNNDKRGRVATTWNIGGISKKGDDAVNGMIVQTMPNRYIGWHLGKTGSFQMSLDSLAVEINNYGYLTKKGDKFYNAYGSEMPADQVCDLGYKFKGRQFWHNYTDEQIEALRHLMLHIKVTFPELDLSGGIPTFLKEDMDPSKAFGFMQDAYDGKIEGTLTHTNVRTGKMDAYPHPKLVELLIEVADW